MKKQILTSWFCFSALIAAAQFTTNDAALDRRFNDYMRLNKELAFDKLLDYLHPSLFKIAPRQVVLQSLQQSFSNPDTDIYIDSLRPVAASQPFEYNADTYLKIEYFMLMRVHFNDSMLSADPDFERKMISIMDNIWPGKKITYDKTSNQFSVAGTEILFAVKDKSAAEWMFLGYQNDVKFLKQLYPNEVLAHFKLL